MVRIGDGNTRIEKRIPHNPPEWDTPDWDEADAPVPNDEPPEEEDGYRHFGPDALLAGLVGRGVRTW